MGALIIIPIIIFGIAQIYAAYLGIELHLGMWWAVGLTAASLMFRTSIILTIASFFGAKDVWHWHWAAALAFAVPGLLFVLPGIAMSLFGAFSRRSVQ